MTPDTRLFSFTGHWSMAGTMPTEDVELESPISSKASEYLTFTRRERSWQLVTQCTFQNSLLAGVGYLELANSGDFAANVWNQVPPPHFAIALMALGATMAISISLFAFADARLSWHNIQVLRQERRHLHDQRMRHKENKQFTQRLDALVDVTFRELGSEIVDRIGMDLLQGFGAILVGIGTALAIGGINPRVYHASNLLSGYIGNAPSLVYGIVNATWSFYMWRRASRHGEAAARQLGDQVVEQRLRRRTAIVKMHAVVNGLTGIVGGIASMVSATMWQGYVALCPCVITAIYTNWIWRRKIGYDRLPINQLEQINKAWLLEELKFTMRARRLIKDDPRSRAVIQGLSVDYSLASVLDFIVKYGFVEDYCRYILKDAELSASLFDLSASVLDIDLQHLLVSDPKLHNRLRNTAELCVHDTGAKRFRYRERYLLETLGCYVCTPEAASAPVEDAVNYHNDFKNDIPA